MQNPKGRANQQGMYRVRPISNPFRAVLFTFADRQKLMRVVAERSRCVVYPTSRADQWDHARSVMH